MNQPEIPPPAHLDSRLQAPFVRRPPNEFVSMPWEHSREGGHDMFSDNGSLQGLSYLSVTPSAVLKDIIGSPFVSPNRRGPNRLPVFEQFRKQQTNVFFEPFHTNPTPSDPKLVDMFLPLKKPPLPAVHPPANVPFRETRRPEAPEPLTNSRSRSNSLSNADENSDDGCGGDKRKLTKGLKLLSIIVRDIVNDRKSTTYKEVADIILRDTINLEQFNLTSKAAIAKEEQNIKRRVYDALNVLISAGILLKEGKKVTKNDQSQKIQINLKRTEINTVHSRIVP